MIRNALQPYSPAVLALFFAGCVVMCYAFVRAFAKGASTWE